MEIKQSPHNPIHPLRPTSLVEDGDVGHKGNFYRRSRKQDDQEKKGSGEAVPRLDGTSRIIDIHV